MISEFKPNINDVKLVFLNAKRLFEDSNKVSFPSSVSLSILSLEEISKGYWFIFHLFIPLLNNNDLSMESIEDGIDNYINEYGFPECFSGATKGFIKQIRNFTFEDFKKHNKKLDFMASLIEFIYQIFSNLEIFKKNHRIDFINENPELSDHISEKFIEHFKSIKIKNVKDFYKLKENGFYCDYKDKKLISPNDIDFSKFQEDEWKTTISGLILGLEFANNYLFGISRKPKR